MSHDSWHIVTITKLKVTNPVFDEMRAWCRSNIGLIDKPDHNWDWGSFAGYAIWFAFRNRSDYVLFILTWGDYV